MCAEIFYTDTKQNLSWKKTSLQYVICLNLYLLFVKQKSLLKGMKPFFQSWLFFLFFLYTYSTACWYYTRFNPWS